MKRIVAFFVLTIASTALCQIRHAIVWNGASINGVDFQGVVNSQGVYINENGNLVLQASIAPQVFPGSEPCSTNNGVFVFNKYGQIVYSLLNNVPLVENPSHRIGQLFFSRAVDSSIYSVADIFCCYQSQTCIGNLVHSSVPIAASGSPCTSVHVWGTSRGDNVLGYRNGLDLVFGCNAQTVASLCDSNGIGGSLVPLPGNGLFQLADFRTAPVPNYNADIIIHAGSRMGSEAIWLLPQSIDWLETVEWVLIALKGSAADGVVGETYSSFQSATVIGDVSRGVPTRVSFIATISDGRVGIWTHLIGSQSAPIPMVLTGDAAPGLAGAYIDSIAIMDSNNPLSMSNSGDVLFYATFVDSNGLPATPQEGLCIARPAGGVELVIAAGDTVIGRPCETVSSLSIGLTPLPFAITASGVVAFEASLESNRHAVLFYDRTYSSRILAKTGDVVSVGNSQYAVQYVSSNMPGGNGGTGGMGTWLSNYEVDDNNFHLGVFGQLVQVQNPGNSIYGALMLETGGFHQECVPACCCVGDFNCSGGVPDDADIDAFFDSWGNGSCLADIDGSGGVPDDADISAFFIAWQNGCD